MADSVSWKRWVGRGVAYTLFTLGIYLLALWYFLPYEELARRCEVWLSQQNVIAELKGLGPGSLLGLKAESLSLAPVSQPDLMLPLTALRLRFVPEHVVRGEIALGVRAETMGGHVEATVTMRESPVLQASWEAFRLDQLPLPEIARSLPLRGTAAGWLNTALDRTNPLRSSGELNLVLNEAKIEAGSVQGIPFPELLLGQGNIEVSASDGKIDIQRAELEGGDLAVSFSGTLLLREDLERSLLNGMLSLQPNDKAARDLALLFALFPSEKGSDGRYTARVRGSLGAPRLLKR